MRSIVCARKIGRNGCQPLLLERPVLCGELSCDCAVVHGVACQLSKPTSVRTQVMDLLGPSLWDRWNREGQRMPEHLVACIAVEALTIIEHLHTKGYAQQPPRRRPGAADAQALMAAQGLWLHQNYAVAALFGAENKQSLSHDIACGNLHRALLWGQPARPYRRSQSLRICGSML